MKPIAFILGLALLPAPRQSDGQGDPRWYLAQLRLWLSRPCGPGRACETWQAVAGRPAVEASDPLYRKHARLFSKGCRLSGERPPALPAGKLVRWDVDGDGRPELVFAGGCTPEPYFVILTASGDAFAAWRDFPARLLGISLHERRLVLMAAREGYGVARDSSFVLWDCEPRDASTCRELVFRWAGEISGPLPESDIRPCSLARDAALRTGPRVDDRPEESGMGFEWPGNLYQMLAAGSSGWVLHLRRGADGGTWALAVFQAPADAPRDPLAAIERPHRAGPPVCPGPGSRAEYILGWIRSDDLVPGPAHNPH
ncbi:MAG: hypothetical protein JXR96_28450 [Deltaproteobacteria bacterium]|nr:hypothetical protein [Deltaproteobacteria bacterium]